MSGPLQVEFYFTGAPLNDSGARTEYAGFNLNGVEYKIGDCAFLYPEDEGVPPYVGAIRAVFHDETKPDPHCVEVAWYERRAHLEPTDSQSPDWEREVVALEETDINPIGCICGKATVLKAGGYEEASLMAKSTDSVDWLFCRGVYKQDENCIMPYPELAQEMDKTHGTRPGKRAQAGVSGQAEVVADSDDVKRRRVIEEQPAAPVRRTGKLVSGRTCVECGATQTPQWREGPAGPKTLCNACGVRYVRAQQRANKRAVPSGASRGLCGAGSRQARAAKAAKADAAAAARSARAAVPEASQRPLRQAALMAASKTAQYARTGVFPQSVMEIQAYDTSSGGDAEPTRQHPALDLADGTAETPGTAAAYAAAAAHFLAQGRPATPNCSSYDSSGSLAEGFGVTVEVVIEAGDGEGSCCGAAAGAGVGQGAAPLAAFPVLLAPAAAGGAAQVPLAAVGAVSMPAAPPLLAPAVFATEGTCMVPTDPAQAAMSAGLLAQAPLQHLQQAGGVPVLQGPLATGAGGACPLYGTNLAMGDATAVCRSAQGGSGQQACGIADGVAVIGLIHKHQVVRGLEQVGGPALSGGEMAMAGQCSASGADLGESPAAGLQVISAPVSPSGRSSLGGCADQQQSTVPFGSEDDGSGVGLVDDNLQNVYGGMYGGQLDDEYGPLVEVEVDFGLGPASAMGSGALFDEFSVGGCDNEDFQLPYPLTRQQSQPHGSCCQPQQDFAPEDDDGVRTTDDLPVVAALAAAFCPELAPGQEARELLDAMPVLAPQPPPLQRQPQADADGMEGSGITACSRAASSAMPFSGSGGGVSAFAAAAAVAAAESSGEEAVGPLPDEAVAQLLTLGRRASRATTDAMAADAALQAATEVFEAHQEAARKAHEAAITNLGRLQECISSLASATSAGSSADTASEVLVSGAPTEPAGGCGGTSGGVHLIDLRDLSCLGGLGAAGMAGGYGFDASEMVVAVHS